MGYIQNIHDLSDFQRKTINGYGMKARKNRIFNHYLLRQITLAKSSLNWLNLPLEIPELVVEESLIYHVTSVFFYEEEMNLYMILPCVVDSTLNPYGIPKKVIAYGRNGYTRVINLEANEGVLIYDNYARLPIIDSLCMFAQRMTDTLITTDVNLMQQRIPIIFRTTQQGKKNVEEAMGAQDAGAYAIIADNTLEENIAQPLYQQVPFIAPALQTELEKIWAEALTFIGIVNVDEKAERLNSYEVGSQLEEVVSQLNTRLKPRKEACKKINEIFGLDLDVIPASWVLTRDRSEVVNGPTPTPATEPEEVEEGNVNELT